MIIVIAWVEWESAVVRLRRSDLGERPVVMPERAARTAVWCYDGTAADVARARDYARSRGYAVHVYEADEPEPRRRAARAVLRAARETS